MTAEAMPMMAEQHPHHRHGHGHLQAGRGDSARQLIDLLDDSAAYCTLLFLYDTGALQAGSER